MALDQIPNFANKKAPTVLPANAPNRLEVDKSAAKERNLLCLKNNSLCIIDVAGHKEACTNLDRDHSIVKRLGLGLPPVDIPINAPPMIKCDKTIVFFPPNQSANEPPNAFPKVYAKLPADSTFAKDVESSVPSLTAPADKLKLTIFLVNIPEKYDV